MRLKKILVFLEELESNIIRFPNKTDSTLNKCYFAKEKEIVILIQKLFLAKRGSILLFI